MPGNSELIKVKINPIMQLIDDEIKRLEKPNYFLNSSKNKIGALEILKYKIKEHIDSKTLQEIITDWKNDNTKFKKLNTKDNKVAIGLIIKENRNAFFSQWRKNITGTEKFIDNLQIDFGSFTAGEKNEARIDSKSPPLR